MSASELIEYLEAAGAWVVVRDGRPALKLPPGQSRPDDETISALTEFRAAVLEHFGRTREAAGTCAECGCGVRADEGAAVFACCGRLLCPYWRPGLGPAWFARARSYATWKRREEAERTAESSQPIPE